MRIYTALFALLLLIAVPLDAFACACCADRGFHAARESKFDNFLDNEVKKLLPTTAMVFTDASYPENIEGLGSESTEFKVQSPFDNGIWGFNLTDEAGKKGMVQLTKPTRVRQLMFDNAPESRTTTVELTKLFTFRGKVTGLNGFLSGGESYDLSYELVLKGKGNMCTMASDFNSYILKIEGLKASYSLFGKLRVAEDRLMQSRGDSRGSTAPPNKPNP